MKFVIVVAIVLPTVLIALQAWRLIDDRHAARAWTELARRGQQPAGTFDPAIVADLPEPARRFFLFAIAAGAPIRTVTEIEMTGEIGLGTQDDPRYLPMRAQQILAPPYGLVWKLDAGTGAMRISGSDGFDGERSWVRFWLMRAVPIVRAGGSRDHARAAFGRVVAEAVFWAPAAVLPGDGVSWEAVGADVARATVTHRDMRQTVDVTVDDDGRPTMVVVPRWTNANPEKTYRLQPFGGFLSEFRDFGGYRLPARVEGGNFIGTDAYFPFYKARVVDVRFVTGG